ncbi:hypothetical protein [Methanolobus sp.]|uniref:hypothetical protein n=1 Tax=Methanolobus sp. TaxID=1874737 RepID=UPI0025EDA327|nr:hypothetical protein [Methanolobus sp.]
MIKKIVLPYQCRSQMRVLVLLCAITMVFLAISSTAVAEVTEVSIFPENPSPGETVTVTGKASPDEVIPVSASFEKVQDVSAGNYAYSLIAVTIPEGSESFSLKASGVDDLNIEVRLPILGYTSIPGSMINVNGHVATFGTGKINSGTYDIKLSGNSPDDKVTLSFNVKASITADADGNFAYTYTTDNIPEGDFNILIGGVPLQVHLGSTDISSPSSSKTKTSSNTGTDLNIVDADTLDTDTHDTGISEADTSEVSYAPGEDTVSDNYVEGYELSPVPSGIMDKLPDLGVMSVLVGIVSIGAILVGYRKNRYK